MAACDAHTCFAFDLAFASAVGCGDKADVPPFLQVCLPVVRCICHDRVQCGLKQVCALMHHLP